MSVRHLRPMQWAQFGVLLLVLSLLLFMILVIIASTAGNTDRYMNFPQGAGAAVDTGRSG